MEKSKVVRAIAINNRIKELEEVKILITPIMNYKLSYIDRDNDVCSEWIRKVIGDLLDRHDLMIRAEIQEEIERLDAEIESL